MKFEVYCDESRPDLLSSSNPQARFLVIGSVWLAADDREEFKENLHSLRNKHRVGGEFKWQKVSPSRLEFYTEVVTWFASLGDRLRFRCIAIDRSEVNLQLFHDNDQEMGFYKFYYQLLHHWILDFNNYAIFVDFKLNRRSDRLKILHRCLDLSNLSSQMHAVQAVRSEESVLIQLADVLTGIASYRLNQQVTTDSAKASVLQHLEGTLNREIMHTAKSEQKFNVFKINLTGGW